MIDNPVAIPVFGRYGLPEPTEYPSIPMGVETYISPEAIQRMSNAVGARPGPVLSKWDKRFMDLASLVASWSKDDSTQVGCVIVDDKNRVISLGYNGPPRDVSDEYKSREQKYLKTIHAELNALFFANRDLTGATVYVTHPPCARCAANIIQNGVKRVVFYRADDGFMERWKDDYAEARAMFRDVDVHVVIVEREAA